jgi:hypothetical protein
MVRPKKYLTEAALSRHLCRRRLPNPPGKDPSASSTSSYDSPTKRTATDGTPDPDVEKEQKKIIDEQIICNALKPQFIYVCFTTTLLRPVVLS